MKRTKTAVAMAVCAVCLFSAKAAIHLDWQTETIQSRAPLDNLGFPAASTLQPEGDYAQMAYRVPSQSKIPEGGSAPGIAYSPSGLSSSSEGGSATVSSDIQFNGAVITPVPERANDALALFGLVLTGGLGRSLLAGRLRRNPSAQSPGVNREQTRQREEACR